MAYEFSINNLYISEESERLNYASNNYNTNNLISWKDRCDALALLELLSIYSDEDTTHCVCYSNDNYIVYFVSKLFPKIQFHVFGGVIESKDNIKYMSDELSQDMIKVYHDTKNVILFLNINNSNYWKLREEELNKRGLNESDVTTDNLNGAKYFMIKDALLQATNRCEIKLQQDMILQYNIFEAINPEHGFIRFRLPYNSNDRLYVEYFKGILYFPIWGKDIQRDTWLKPVKNYETEKWNTYDYESWIFHHNIIERQSRTYINFFTERIENIYSNELTNNYDSLAEALIFALYIEKTINKKDYDMTIELSKSLTQFLNQKNGGDMTLAKLRFLRDMSLGYSSDPFA